jgi:hypothetical protein
MKPPFYDNKIMNSLSPEVPDHTPLFREGDSFLND